MCVSKLQLISGVYSCTCSSCLSRPTLGTHKNIVCRTGGTKNGWDSRPPKGKEVCQELDFHCQTSLSFPRNDSCLGNCLSSNRDHYLVCPPGDLDNLCPL